MILRCTDPLNIGWKGYGGRGITVCERWRTFEAFYADMGDRPSPLHSLERKNNDAGYEPANCKWADKKTQASNRRSSRFVSLYGYKTHITEACERLGLSPQSMRKKAIRRGVSIQDLIDEHVYKRRCEISDPYHAMQTGL
jgi:hypothetical protein